MTPDQVKLVQESFAKVAPISDQAAVIFYDRLFEAAPQVKAMFPADMTEQRKKLMATLAVVVNGLAKLRIDPAGGERAGPAARRLRRQARALSGGRRRAVVDAGKGTGRGLDPRGCRRLDRRLRHAVRLHDRRGLRQASGRGVERWPMSEPLVIVGNGMAAARLVDELATDGARPLRHRRDRRRAAARL